MKQIQLKQVSKRFGDVEVIPPLDLEIEDGFSPDTISLLKTKGHNVKSSLTMGSVQAIFIKDEVIYGVADTRRPGALAKGN